MKIFRKMILVLTVPVIFSGFSAELPAQTEGMRPLPPAQEDPVKPGAAAPVPKTEFQPPKKMRSGPGMWRIFSRLSAEEKKSLLELQRRDPEQYRARMRELAERFNREEQARLAENERLAALCRKYPENSEEGKKARAELRARVAEDFQRHLNDNRRSLEESRRRLAFMESELKKRETNAGRIIDAVVGDLISGKRPEIPPHHRGAMPAPHRP